MPTETAATWSRTRAGRQLAFGDEFGAGVRSSASQAPVIEAQRVPPSACSTSQSRVIWRSPRGDEVGDCAQRTAYQGRWISSVRPDCLPLAASRAVRVWVERAAACRIRR